MLVAGGIGHHEWQAACSGAPFQPAGVTVVVTETCWAGGWCCAPATWWQGDGALWERRDSRHYLWHDPSGASGYSSADRHPAPRGARLSDGRAAQRQRRRAARRGASRRAGAARRHRRRRRHRPHLPAGRRPHTELLPRGWQGRGTEESAGRRRGDAAAIRRRPLPGAGRQPRTGARHPRDGPDRGHPRHLRDLRALSGGGADVFVEDRLFATLDTLTREVDVGDNYRVRLTDTVGFIRKLPHHLVASFRATLEEAREADLLLHVIDAGHPAWEEQVEVVDRALIEMRNSELGTRNDSGSAERKRVIHVFNKADLLPDPEAFLAQVRERYPHAVLTSTVPRSALPVPTWVGVEGLRSVLRTSAQALRPIARNHVPLGDGKLLAALHRDAEVLAETQVDGVVQVTARVQAWLLGKLRRQGIEVEIAP